MVTNSESFFPIKFRTKFEKLVTDENRPILVSAFEDFCQISPVTNYALEILWQLTYNNEVAISTISNTLDLSLDIISVENISKLRDELRYQYELRHKSFSSAYVKTSFSAEFDNLAKYAGNICAVIVTRKCLEYHEESCYPERALHLLTNNSENNYYGGLRELGFDQDEAQFLKQYHNEISSLYAAIYNILDLDYTPSIKEDDVTLPFFYGNNNFKPLTSVEILSNREPFASFVEDFNALIEIGKMGFDLNMVIAKKEAIIQLLNADKALSE